MTSANEAILPLSRDYGTPATASDLYAIFELTASTGKADAVRDLMVPIVAKARTEPGCKYCVLLQVQPESVRILTYEIWTSRDAQLARHRRILFVQTENLQNDQLL